jgi:hypothetical protein
MSWLVYSRLPSPEPRTAEEMQESTVAPIFEPRSPHPYAVDYIAGRERAQPAHKAEATTEQQYYQEIATEPYANSGLNNGSVAVDSPSYAEVDQEPAVVPSDYPASPQTVVYAQPVQIVVFSNSRRFVNRCRSTPYPGALRTITHQCPDRGNSHLNDTRVVSCPNVSTPSCPPTQGPRPRGTVRQSGVTGSQQKRVAFPGLPGAARRSLSVP